MFNQLNDDEFCREVHKVLMKCCSKEHDIKEKMSEYFGKSYSFVVQRYRRLSRKTILAAHDELLLELAMKNLKESFCIEVMIDLGFKSESYFARWFKKLSGMTPSEYKKLSNNAVK